MELSIKKNTNLATINLLSKIKIYFEKKYSITANFFSDDILIALTKMNFTLIVCSDIIIQNIVEYNQPVILKVDVIFSDLNQYIVCYHFDLNKGFLIDDSNSDNSKPYYISKENLATIWKEKKCIAFIANAKK